MHVARGAHWRKPAGLRIAAVVSREPEWNLLPAATPPHLRRLLDRCLRKDPKLRLRDIGDARRSESPGSGMPGLHASAAV